METKSPNILTQIPPLLFALDLFGTLSIGVGIWILVTDSEVPILAGYDREVVGGGMILLGALLMIPFVIAVLRVALRNRASSVR